MTNKLIFGIVCILVCACKGRTPPASEGLPVDFQVFYELFHRDSAYQMEHIIFPLEGLPDYADFDIIGDKTFYWPEDVWEIHRKFDKENPDFRQEITVLADNMIMERFINTKTPIMLERRFSKMGDEWYLIYYAGLNAYREGTTEK